MIEGERRIRNSMQRDSWEIARTVESFRPQEPSGAPFVRLPNRRRHDGQES
jgi:hypothetical protein